MRAEAVFGLWKSRHGGGRSLKYFASPLQSVPFSYRDWAKREGGPAGEADFTLRHGSARSTLHSGVVLHSNVACDIAEGGGVDRWSEDEGE